MARPKQDRYIKAKPQATYFKPRGIPMVDLEEARLSVEELEAVRLADLEGLTQAEAAENMRISRHTFGRILAQAHKTIAEALVLGRALRIEGGNWVFAEPAMSSCCRRAANDNDECVKQSAANKG